MYIDYGTEFSIEKFSHIPLQSQEDADAQSMPVDSQSQPEEQQAAADEAAEAYTDDVDNSMEGFFDNLKNNARESKRFKERWYSDIFEKVIKPTIEKERKIDNTAVAFRLMKCGGADYEYEYDFDRFCRDRMKDKTLTADERIDELLSEVYNENYHFVPDLYSSEKYEKAAEAYNIYLERHPEMSIEEQIVEAEEKLNDIAKNSKVNKAKQSKLKIDEKLKRQAERKHDPALDDPKEAAKRAQIEKHKKEAREEYMRRHSMEFFGFGENKKR